MERSGGLVSLVVGRLFLDIESAGYVFKLSLRRRLGTGADSNELRLRRTDLCAKLRVGDTLVSHRVSESSALGVRGHGERGCTEGYGSCMSGGYSKH